MGELLSMRKSIYFLFFAILISGCNNTNSGLLAPKTVNKFEESKILKVKNRDIYNEMLHINDRLVNSDKRVQILNEKVKILSERKDKTVEIETKLEEHEKVLMALMNDVVDLSKGQKNLQKSNIAIHEEINDIKLKIESFIPTTFEIVRRSNIRVAPWKRITKVWEKGKRFTAFNSYAGEWIRVSGVFVEGKWTAIKDDLWVHTSNIKKFK
jgi:seryl-tRNA synthetase